MTNKIIQNEHKYFHTKAFRKYNEVYCGWLSDYLGRSLSIFLSHTLYHPMVNKKSVQSVFNIILLFHRIRLNIFIPTVIACT